MSPAPFQKQIPIRYPIAACRRPSPGRLKQFPRLYIPIAIAKLPVCRKISPPKTALQQTLNSSPESRTAAENTVGDRRWIEPSLCSQTDGRRAHKKSLPGRHRQSGRDLLYQLLPMETRLQKGIIPQKKLPGWNPPSQMTRSIPPCRRICFRQRNFIDSRPIQIHFPSFLHPSVPSGMRSQSSLPPPRSYPSRRTAASHTSHTRSRRLPSDPSGPSPPPW